MQREHSTIWWIGFYAIIIFVVVVFLWPVIYLLMTSFNARVLLVDCDPAGGAITAPFDLSQPRPHLPPLGRTVRRRSGPTFSPGLISPASLRRSCPSCPYARRVSVPRRARAASRILFDNPVRHAAHPGWVHTGWHPASCCRRGRPRVRAEPTAFKEVSPFLKLVESGTSRRIANSVRGLLLTLPEGEPLGGSWESELRRAFAFSLLPHAVPYDPEVTRSATRGKTVVTSNPTSPAARQYAALAQRLGLVRSDGENVDLFPTPSPFAPEPSPESPDQVRTMLGEDVREVADSLSRVIRPAPTDDPPAQRPIAEIRTMSTPNSADDVPAARGHTGDITAVAYSPDGRTLATASWISPSGCGTQPQVQSTQS